MKKLIAALALGALVATPAFAHAHGSHVGAGKVASSKGKHAHVRKAGRHAFARVAPRTQQSTSPYAAFGAVTPFGSPTDRQNSQSTMTPVREAAIQECSRMERTFNGVGGNQDRWGAQAITLYRSCMMQHGQVE